MHVCSRIVKVVSTKSIVIISSKDRDTPPLSVSERELEMQEAAEIEERREEELPVSEVEVEKSLSVEESAVEYQRELWRSHYYEY